MRISIPYIYANTENTEHTEGAGTRTRPYHLRPETRGQNHHVAGVCINTWTQKGVRGGRGRYQAAGALRGAGTRSSARIRPSVGCHRDRRGAADTENWNRDKDGRRRIFRENHDPDGIFLLRTRRASGGAADRTPFCNDAPSDRARGDGTWRIRTAQPSG